MGTGKGHSRGWFFSPQTVKHVPAQPCRRSRHPGPGHVGPERATSNGRRCLRALCREGAGAAPLLPLPTPASPSCAFSGPRASIRCAGPSTWPLLEDARPASASLPTRSTGLILFTEGFDRQLRYQPISKHTLSHFHVTDTGPDTARARPGPAHMQEVPLRAQAGQGAPSNRTVGSDYICFKSAEQSPS